MTTTHQDLLQPADLQTISNRQRLFTRYFTAILIDLVVLNLFEEYWEHVVIDSFTVSLFVAILLQILLKLTIALESRVAAFFNARPGGVARFMRFFGAWLVLFGSKFVMLEAIDVAFGDNVDFGGPGDGLVALLVVTFTMLVAEEAIVRLARRLA